MNDRYLFKAKRIDWKNLPKEEQWVQGYFVKKHGIPFILETRECPQNSYEIYESTLCRCTGMKDKAGKRIWDNDIVKHRGDLYMCIWNEYNLEYSLDNKDETFGLGYTTPYSLKIVGNRFDNPELLEVE